MVTLPHGHTTITQSQVTQLHSHTISVMLPHNHATTGHTITWSHNQVTQSHGHTTTWSHNHMVTLPHGHTTITQSQVTQLHSHTISVMLPHNHATTGHTITWSHSYIILLEDTMYLARGSAISEHLCSPRSSPDMRVKMAWGLWMSMQLTLMTVNDESYRR